MLDALIDGRRGGSVDLQARGLHYADGLFESIRRVDGRLPLWPWHAARLAFASRALGLRPPPAEMLRAQLLGIAPAHPDCALKLMLWATDNGRGYGRAWPAEARVGVLAYPLPAPLEAIDACSASHPLGIGGSPHGLKTLARIEQVRAHSQALAVGASAALLHDRHGRPLCFSHGNLYLRLGSELFTAPLAHGALAGVGRAWLLGQVDLRVRVVPLSRSLLEQADEVLFSNALRGVLPVRSIDRQTWTLGSCSAELARRWQNLLSGRSLAGQGVVD
jgi:4-amino-4-deoxychorismate lyase